MARDFDSFLCPMPSGCIEWAGVTVKSNSSEAHRYGRFTSGGRKHLAHRVAYERAFGEIPEGMLVLHRCDNTKCCNQDHLFLGTHLDNMADMRAKGRSNKSNKNPARGERASGSKLTENDVREIRRLLSDGVTTVALGQQFSVNPSAISRISTGKTWSHL